MPGRTFYINEKKPSACRELARTLQTCICKIDRPWDELVFLCVGSDRITGDSLGPLCGHQLSRYIWKNSYVYGTLDQPVHALNLTETKQWISARHPRCLMIAIDASLGSRQHLGFITAGVGSITPGAGVQKDLPEIGDIFITGIVNLSGAFEHFMLQTTRLSFIMGMADTITLGILMAFSMMPEKNYFYRENGLTDKIEWAAADEGAAAFSLEG
jgi:putative sporulation protein YyaC